MSSRSLSSCWIVVFRPLSLANREKKQKHVCWSMLIIIYCLFFWWTVSIESRLSIISSVIASYCIDVPFGVECILPCVDVVPCQSINFLRSIPYLLFIIIVISGASRKSSLVNYEKEEEEEWRRRRKGFITYEEHSHIYKVINRSQGTYFRCCY